MIIQETVVCAPSHRSGTTEVSCPLLYRRLETKSQGDETIWRALYSIIQLLLAREFDLFLSLSRVYGS